MSDVEGLERRIAALTARRDALRARTRKRERAEDLRRKIILGALVMSRWKQGQVPAEWQRLLSPFLARPHDRKLFGLPS